MRHLTRLLHWRGGMGVGRASIHGRRVVTAGLERGLNQHGGRALRVLGVRLVMNIWEMATASENQLDVKLS